MSESQQARSASIAALDAYLRKVAANHREAGRLPAAEEAELHAKNLQEFVRIASNTQAAYAESARALEETVARMVKGESRGDVLARGT